MATYRLLVLSNPVEGREDEYNDWYTDRHLGDIVSLDGFVAAQRFRFVRPRRPGQEPEYRYLAIYEVEEGKLDAAHAALVEASADREQAHLENRQPRVPGSDALGDRVAWWFETVTDRVTRPGV
jgi:hypothetical protein